MKIAICDDELNYVKEIKTYVLDYEREVDEIFEISTFTNAKELLDSYETTTYDLIYLDIEMNEYNGIQMASEIKKNSPNCLIIFVTSYMQYMNESFHVEAFQFLTKPLGEELFRNELERAFKKYKKSNKSLLVTTTHGNHVISFKEIIYIETFYREYKLFCVDSSHYGSIKSYQKIKDILTQYNFYKIQRSFMVNLEHVKELNGDEIVLTNGESLTISRKNLKSFKKAFFRFLEN